MSLNKINKSYQNFKNYITNDIKLAKSKASKLVLAILLSTWSWIATKAEANIPNFSKTIEKHTVVKWDWLLKIAKKYWITINKIIELNKWKKFGNHQIIWKNNTIYLWSNLIIKDKYNDDISIFYTKNKVIEKTKEIIQNKKINLNHAVKYSAMYKKSEWKYKKFYTISPSDNPIFTWNTKNLNWKLYVEVILSNDKYITWYVRISTFTKSNQSLIIQSTKNTKKSSHNIEKIVKQDKTMDFKKEKIEKLSNKNHISKHITNTENISKITNQKNIISNKDDLNIPLNNTLKYASSNKNILKINNIKQLSILSKKLKSTQNLIDSIKNKNLAKKVLFHKIELLSSRINIENKLNDNSSLTKIFDFYATLERLDQFKIYFSHLTFEEAYKLHIKKDFWWKWAKWLKYISKKAWLDKNILTYNSSLKKEIIIHRQKAIKELLALISKAENTNNNYNAIFSNWNQQKIKYTKMTLEKVLIDMKKRIKTKGSSATWKYQFLYLTLKNLSKKYNIDINTQKFTPNFQEKIAYIKLKERWLEDFLKWKIKRDDFQLNLSKEWASLAKDQTEKSYHHDDWINKAFCSNNKIDLILDNIKNPRPKNETKTMLASL